MSVKTFLTILSLIGLLFGVAELLAPETMANIYGAQTSPHAALMSRLFGVALLAWAMIGWFAKDFHDEADLRHVLAPTAFANSAGLIVAAMGTMNGVTNAMGWVSALIFLFGAVGSFYFLTARLPHGLVHN
jgi:hypothetical protein